MVYSVIAVYAVKAVIALKAFFEKVITSSFFDLENS